MKHPVLTGLCFLVCTLYAQAQNVRVASVNIWSGLDYSGTLCVGEVETDEQRALRHDSLVRALRALDADIIALQEVNPSSSLTCDIADALGYDAVSHRVNAGLKAGRVGLPWNLNEGIAILAKRALRLELVDVVDLSGNFGVSGNILSFHFTENNAALVARVMIDGAALHIVNVHLDASVPATRETREWLDVHLQKAGTPSTLSDEMRRDFEERAAKRRDQALRLRGYLDEKIGPAPMILLGDFNTTVDDSDLRILFPDSTLTDVTAGLPPTWDPRSNTHVALSRAAMARVDSGDAIGALGYWHDGMARKIDHIFAGPGLLQSERGTAALIGAGAAFSDHYGVYADINLRSMLSQVPHDGDGLPSVVPKSWEYFPVPVYDSNFGLAIVAKTLLVNQLGARESFDAMGFFSMKGEKYFKFVTSFPHTDVRQGKVYDMAADLELRYDWNPEYNFYGIGSAAPFERGEKLTREFVDAALTFSRGWTTRFVTDVRLRWMWNRNTDFSDSGVLAATPDARGTERVTASSLRVSARYDTRDIFFNPSRGVVAELELEYAVPLAVRDAEFARIGATLQWYTALFYPRTVLAARLTAQSVFGAGIPVHYLPSIGGNDTQRGLTADRFVDKTTAIANVELRFPIVWRFGAVLGLDAGKVWPDPLRVDLNRWSVGCVVGLRFYYDTFVARADVGFGPESTGLYLNFGQAF